MSWWVLNELLGKVSMKERPIIFKAEMVRAILDGRKKQTRRIVKFPKHTYRPDASWVQSIHKDGGGNWIAWSHDDPGMAEFTKKAYPNGEGFPCNYGKPGDRLWVREKHGIQLEPYDELPKGEVVYAADWPTDATFQFEGGGSAWRPSIFMPRWASRITLEITGVRVERLQEISSDDAYDEGYPKIRPNQWKIKWPRMWFAEYWDSLNLRTSYSFESNPWVWVIEFKVVSDK